MGRQAGIAAVIGLMVVSAAPVAWAACTGTDVVEHDFIGRVCPGTAPVVEIREGQWVLEEGGIFSGSSTIEDFGGATKKRTITKTGRLHTQSFQGTLTSTTTGEQLALGAQLALHEVRNGKQTYPDGGEFSGTITLDVTEVPDTSGTGVPLTTTSLNRSGSENTHIHSGKLGVTRTHKMQDTAVVQSLHTTNMQGEWRITPTQKLNGTMTIQINNGVKTVTDNRTPTAI